MQATTVGVTKEVAKATMGRASAWAPKMGVSQSPCGFRTMCCHRMVVRYPTTGAAAMRRSPLTSRADMDQWIGMAWALLQAMRGMEKAKQMATANMVAAGWVITRIAVLVVKLGSLGQKMGSNCYKFSPFVDL